MSVRRIKAGTTDVSVVIRIIDSTDGTPETGVVFNTSGIDLWYRREGAASVDITEATLAALTTAHTDGGFLHINDGWYRLDLPDAACASGVSGVQIGGTVTGMIVLAPYIELDVNTPADVYTRLGAPAGASVSADIAAVQSDTNDIQTRLPAALVSGRIDASVGAMASNVMTAAAAAADLTTELQSGLATSASITALDGKIDTIDNFLDTEIAAILAAVDTEIATIDTVVDAIKATTDKLDDTLEDSGGGAYIFTEASLANAPGGAGGGATAQEVWEYATRTLTAIDEDSTTLDIDAAVRAAVGLASANLDTQIADLPTVSELASEINSVQSDIAALNDLDAAGVRTAVGLASANLDTQLAKLDTIDDFLDTEVAAIKAKTDSLTFTVAGVVDANIQRINDVTIIGNGQSGTEFSV